MKVRRTSLQNLTRNTTNEGIVKGKFGKGRWSGQVQQYKAMEGEDRMLRSIGGKSWLQKEKRLKKELYWINIVFWRNKFLLEGYLHLWPIHFLSFYFSLLTNNGTRGRKICYFSPFLLNQTIRKKTFFSSFSIFWFFSSLTNKVSSCFGWTS